MSERVDPGLSAGKMPIDDAFEKRRRTLNSETYARTMQSVLEDFQEKAGVSYLEDVTDDHCRDYASLLHGLYNDEEIQPSTARKRYHTLRAFFNWCVEDNLLETNPAKPERAAGQLPKDSTESDPQYWDPEDREAFESHVDRRNDRAQDGEIDAAPYVAQRDQVLVYLLAQSGARGAELFRVPNDRQRMGLRWSQAEADAFKVFGKSRDEEWIGYTGPDKARLDRWRRRLKPASDDWPVFPTLYPGTLHRADHGVGDELEAAGYDPASDQHPIAACREHGITPPALSIQAARTVVRELSEAAGLPTDPGEDEKDYLTLHGARRGLGAVLYDADPVEAQRTLRHDSIETTFAAYSDQEAKKSGKRRAEILGIDAAGN